MAEEIERLVKFKHLECAFALSIKIMYISLDKKPIQGGKCTLKEDIVSR
jgi:hypothetical protein